MIRLLLVLTAMAALEVNMAAAAQITVWAIDDSVRVNPETGKLIEDNPDQLPGCVSGDYRSGNWAWSARDRTVRLWAAKNEVVAFQVIVEGKAKRVTLSASALAGPAGREIPARQLKLFRQWYIWVDRQEKGRACMAPLGALWYPDVAIPLGEPKFGNGFSIPSRDFHDPSGKRLPSQTNQAIWVDLHVPEDAAAGAYTGKISIEADGQAVTVNIALHVWDYAIPRELNMHAELMNYGATVREPQVAMMYSYFRLAQEHRTTISDNKAKPAYDGQDYDWKDFDERFGPLFDGSALTDGPAAGVPIPLWTFPVEYGVKRVDKPGKSPFKDWPIPAPKTASGYGVDFTDSFRIDLAAAFRKWEQHFLSKGWTRTRHQLWQDSLDEPGFHKSGEQLRAGREQAEAIFQTASILKACKPRLIFYKLDIGGGNSGNRLDLDGNGKVEGAVDVANYFAPVVPLFSVHGLCIDVGALEKAGAAHGTRAIFYNGYHPRVGPNTITGELLGLRTWAVAAWRSGLSGWADWQFRKDDRKQLFYETNDDAGRNLYFYPGAQIGLDDRLFASLRLKAMRRGAQDYEMLRLLAARDSNDRRAQAIASTVCGAGFKEVRVDLADFQDDQVGVMKPYTGVDKNAHWSHNAEAWEKFRRALGAALSAGK